MIFCQDLPTIYIAHNQQTLSARCTLDSDVELHYASTEECLFGERVCQFLKILSGLSSWKLSLATYRSLKSGKSSTVCGNELPETTWHDSVHCAHRTCVS